MHLEISELIYIELKGLERHECPSGVCQTPSEIVVQTRAVSEMEFKGNVKGKLSKLCH